MRWLVHRYRRRHLWLGLAAVLPLGAWAARPLPGLSDPGQAALGVFGMAAVLWVSGALPLGVTGLAVLGALPALGVMPAADAFALFGNPAVFFILGAFVLAAALMETGLSRRLSLLFLSRFGRSPRRLATGVLVSGAGLSCIMPMHAVAAILFPTVATIADTLELRPRHSRFALLLFLSMAWGCGIGGVATLLGGARAPLALSILREFDGTRFGFLEWSAAAAPVAAVLLAAGGILLHALFRPELTDVEPARRRLAREVASAGPLDRREKKVAAVTALTVAAWIATGNAAGMAVVSLGGATLLFAVGAVSWDEVEDSVNWGVLLMYGGAIALGSALTRTGATEWLAEGAFAALPRAPVLFLTATVAATLVLTEFISNAAAVAVLLPVVLSAANAFGLDPVLATLAVAVPSGFAFTLPVGSPPNAIAFSAGYYRVRDVFGAGVTMAALSLVACVAAAVILWPAVTAP